MSAFAKGQVKADTVGMLQQNGGALSEQTWLTGTADGLRDRLGEFFLAQVRNGHTRRAYWQAVRQFGIWAGERGLKLGQLRALDVAAYMKDKEATLSLASQKLHLAALRVLFDWLVSGGKLEQNPARSVRTARSSAQRGKTMILSKEQVRALLEELRAEPGLAAKRDLALLSVMLYGFGRVSAVVGMKVGDVYQEQEQWWFRLHEKNGKRLEIPAHPEAMRTVSEWLRAGGLEGKRERALFPSLTPGGKQQQQAMGSNDALRMVKRRARMVGLDERICCHSFRATGITNYLAHGGSLEQAQQLAGHNSPMTTKLYDRNRVRFAIEALERMQF